MKEEVFEKKKKGSTSRKIKRGMACCSFLFFLVAVLAVVVGVFTATGHTKKWVCDVVLEDSALWDEIECGKDEKVDTSGQDYSKILEDLGKDGSEERAAVIVKLVQPSVVGIGIKDGIGNSAIVGTGFVVSADGLIATNHHVISESGVKYFVQVEGREDTLEISKIYEDQNNDIAILRVANAKGLKALTLGDSSKLEPGQEVIAIGNPLGELSGSVTKGIISALGRTVEVNQGGFFNSRLESFEGVIQTDAAINPGNSGGPLINMDGEVIGINFATVSGAENLSFALPVDRIKSRLDELEKYGEFRIPYLGVQYRDRTVFVSGKPIVAAEIITVAAGSPAEKADLKKGDFIIGFNGGDMSEKPLYTYIQESEIGEKITLQILRDDKNLEIKVEIGKI